jgi:hypothetical protein
MGSVQLKAQTYAFDPSSEVKVHCMNLPLSTQPVADLVVIGSGRRIGRLR